MTDDDIGLKVLRDAPADATEIEWVSVCQADLLDLFVLSRPSIVAIHGIGAHPDDSWCKNVGTAEDPRWVNWLAVDDMLPAVAPRARIMRYGYQSQWFGEGAMRQKASTVAQRLLLALRRKREVREACARHAAAGAAGTAGVVDVADVARSIRSDRCCSSHTASAGWWC